MSTDDFYEMKLSLLIYNKKNDYIIIRKMKKKRTVYKRKSNKDTLLEYYTHFPSYLLL